MAGAKTNSKTDKAKTDKAKTDKAKTDKAKTDKAKTNTSNPKTSDPKPRKKRLAEDGEATQPSAKKRVTSQGQAKKVAPETPKETSAGEKYASSDFFLIVLSVDLILAKEKRQVHQWQRLR